MDGKQLLAQLIVEFIGTFIFVTVILLATGSSKLIKGPASGLAGAFAIGITLCAVIFFAGQVSYGMFNPAVTLAQTIEGKLNWGGFAAYITTQFVAALCAYYFYKYIYLNYTLPSD